MKKSKYEIVAIVQKMIDSNLLYISLLQGYKQTNAKTIDPIETRNHTLEEVIEGIRKAFETND